MNFNKSAIKIISVILIIFIIIGTVFALIKGNHKPVNLDDIPKYSSNLTSFNIVSSGGISGGYFRVNVVRKDDKSLIESYEQVASGYPHKIENYVASQELINEIERKFYSHGMRYWKDRQDSKFSSSDSPGYTLTFIFDDEICTFESTKIPSNISATGELFSLIDAYSANENSRLMLKDIFLEENLNVNLLKNGYIGADIINKSEADAEFDTSFELFKCVENSETKLEPLKTLDAERFTVPAGSQVPVQFDLNIFGKLEPGEYKLVSNGTYSVFSISE